MFDCQFSSCRFLTLCYALCICYIMRIMTVQCVTLMSDEKDWLLPKYEEISPQDALDWLFWKFLLHPSPGSNIINSWNASNSLGSWGTQRGYDWRKNGIVHFNLSLHCAFGSGSSDFFSFAGNGKTLLAKVGKRFRSQIVIMHLFVDTHNAFEKQSLFAF